MALFMASTVWRFKSESSMSWWIPDSFHRTSSSSSLCHHAMVFLDHNDQNIIILSKYSTIYFTSSTAQGGGGSFKSRKPIGEVGCCESGMAGRSL